jgi:hypothetical protein
MKPYLYLIVLILLSISTKAATYYSRAAGNWSTPATWSTTGFGGVAALTYPGLVAGDVVRISGRSVVGDVSTLFALTSITLDEGSGSATATNLLINGVGITVTTGTLTITENNKPSDVSLQVANNAIFNVTGNVSMSRNGNNSVNLLQLRVSNTAQMNVGGTFTYDYLHAGTELTTDIWLENTAQLTITGLCTINMASTEDAGTLEFKMDNTPTFTCGSLVAVDISAKTAANILFTINGGTFNVTGSANINNSAGTNNIELNLHKGALTAVSTAITMNFNGGLNFNHAAGDDIILLMNNASSTLAATVNVIGNFNINHTGGDDVIFTISQTSVGTTANSTINISSNFNYTHTGGDDFTPSFFYKSYLNISGNFNSTHTSTDGDVISQLYQLSNVSINGNMTVDNNADAVGIVAETNTFLINGSIFTVNGNVTLNLNTGAVAQADDIQWDMNKFNNGTFPNVACVVNVGGAFTMYQNAGRFLRVRADNNTTVTIAGQLFMNHVGGAATSNMSCDLASIAAPTAAPTFTVANLRMNDAGGGTTILSAASTAIFQSNGNVTLDALAQAQTILNINATANFRLRGNFIRAAKPAQWGDYNSAATATTTYNGTTPQIVAADGGSGTDSLLYGILEFNNTFATLPQLSMVSTDGYAIIPTGASLVLTQGVCNTTFTGTVQMNGGSTTTLGNSGSYIDGPLRYAKNSTGASSLNFPVGKGSDWRPFNLNPTHSAATLNVYVGELFNADAEALYWTLPATIQKVSNKHWWDVDRYNAAGVKQTVNNAPLTSSTITLYYKTNFGANDYVTDFANLTIAKAPTAGSAWTDIGGTATANGTGSVVSGAFTSFSRFSLANRIGGNNPLPITLTHIEAKANSNKTATVTWSTSSEINNHKYIVERSTENVDFKPIGEVLGNGTTTLLHTYSFVDENPVSGNNYYRLKQTDFDGTFNYSPIVVAKINNEAISPSITVFPNPTNNGNFSIVLNNITTENTLLTITDSKGSVVCKTTVTPSAQLITSSELGMHFSAGVYVITIHNQQKNSTQKLVVE